MFFIYRTIAKSKYYLIRLALRIVPAELLEKVSRLRAILVAQLIIKKVPAYKEFLKEQGIFNKKIKSLNDFKTLPLMNKEDYFLKYGIEETLLGKSICDGNSWEQSSNYDQKAGFVIWPRFYADEKDCIENLDFAFSYFFKCDKKKTLVIVSFVLGMWAAGERISRFSKKISEKGKFQLTVASPGANRYDTIELIKKIGKHYEQIILFGNPYFLRRVIEYGEAEGIDWKNFNIKLLTGAEGFSEDWREFVLKKIAPEKEVKALVTSRLISTFGTTETNGSFGTETPFTNVIRRLSGRNEELKKKFFGSNTESLPMVFQYNPLKNFIESEKEELIITRLTSQPLLRFNTHDLGKVMSFNKALKILKEYGYGIANLMKSEGCKKEDLLPLPLFFIYGRHKNILKVQGIPFSIERLQEYFAHPKLIKSNTGNFKATVINDEKGTERLNLTVELMDDIKPSLDLTQKYKDIFCSTSKGVILFLKLYDGTMEEIEPIIDLVEKGQDPFSDNEKSKHHYLKKD